MRSGVLAWLLAAAALAAVVTVAGCGPSREARVAFFSCAYVPETVFVNHNFAAHFGIVLGTTYGHILDHVDTMRTDTSWSIRAWSRDTATDTTKHVIFDEIMWTCSTSAIKTGRFRIVALQEDGSTLEKTITVLP